MTKKAIPATSVYMDGMGILIFGKSGAGKSRLAMALIERGASLISDDLTFVWKQGPRLYASGDKMKGCMEVRGIGIVQGFKVKKQAEIRFAVSLTDEYPERLPEQIKELSFENVNIPMFEIHKDEKYLLDLVKIAGKIVSNKLSLKLVK